MPLVLLLATVFFIPMRRYTLPSSLPFHLEPYRPLVALVLVVWVLGLLMGRVTTRRTSLGAPMLLFAFAVLVSLAANPHRIVAETYKFLTLFSTFFLAYLLIVYVVRRREDIEKIVRLVVSFGAVLGGPRDHRGAHGVHPVHPPRPAVSLPPRPPGRPDDRAWIAAPQLRVLRAPNRAGGASGMLVPFAVYLAASTKRLIGGAAAAPS